MELMNDKLKKQILEADENNTKVICKFFYPMGRYTFYILSGYEQDDDLIMFGYCLSPITPDFDEYGYVSLKELEGIPMMERDLYLPEGKTLEELGVEI
ncbi:MAG: hypothetical protein BZ138_08010 [Methanosphaera sp. rholeuAM270]|nr:MAG: hypothetical protein BZ138_08010 [Methanosphaera sp. rholeuAM270]